MTYSYFLSKPYRKGVRRGFRSCFRCVCEMLQEHRWGNYRCSSGIHQSAGSQRANSRDGYISLQQAKGLQSLCAIGYLRREHALGGGQQSPIGVRARREVMSYFMCYHSFGLRIVFVERKYPAPNTIYLAFRRT